jgi:hypothetical protein
VVGAATLGSRCGVSLFDHYLSAMGRDRQYKLHMRMVIAPCRTRIARGSLARVSQDAAPALKAGASNHGDV